MTHETKPKMSAEEMAEMFAYQPFDYHATTPAMIAARGRFDGYVAGHVQGLKEREDEIEKLRTLLQEFGYLACNGCIDFGYDSDLSTRTEQALSESEATV